MKKVLILGGTGFVGRHICEQLNRLGIRVTVPTRRTIRARSVQTLPLVDVIEADIHQPAALAALLPGHDAVVNLVAILHGSQKQFDRVHVELPAQLARAMAEAGVRRLIHVSALGADPAGPSRYQASKARGEEVLRSAQLDLTVLRPSVIFGADDKFLNLFAHIQGLLPVLPLAGAATRFQPVWVGDVAQAVVRCLQQSDSIGQTYECVGPEVMTLGDLARLAGRLSGNPKPVLGLPRAVAYFQALFMEMLPGDPLLSTDNLRSMEVDNVASGQCPTLQALGMLPAAVEPVAASYLESAGRADLLLAVRERAGRMS